ncbi:hypothetical protein [Gilvibacter sediminis]|uniref:hypothetical protein n=1 Tax=Gilvibacter sediminis TaxID=379071 RepID=UPI0023507B8A|nr:hypothetical protein [Gilvibacter sediminis]MDC7996887.1 hypothetical protein [Gilvibacter sediminis]
MKVNKTTYLLLVVVLGIWGYFIVSLVSDLSGDDALDTSSLKGGTITTYESKEKERFELIENPRDPFFGTMNEAPKNTSAAKTQSTSTKANWPSIIYKGKVSGSKNATRYILAINGKEYLVTKGQVITDVTLISGDTEAVKVRFEGQTKTFAKQ